MDIDTPSDEALEPHILTLLPSDGTPMLASDLQDALSREMRRPIEPRAFAQARDRLVDHGIVGRTLDEDGRIFLLTDLGGTAPDDDRIIPREHPAPMPWQAAEISDERQAGDAADVLAGAHRPPAPARRRRYVALALGVVVAIAAVSLTRQRASRDEAPTATVAHLAPAPEKPGQPAPPPAATPRAPGRAEPRPTPPAPVTPKDAGLPQPQRQASALPSQPALPVPSSLPPLPPEPGELAVLSEPRERPVPQRESAQRWARGEPGPVASKGPASPVPAGSDMASAPTTERAVANRQREPETSPPPASPSAPAPNPPAPARPSAGETSVAAAPERAAASPPNEARTSTAPAEPSPARLSEAARSAPRGGETVTTAKGNAAPEIPPRDAETGALRTEPSPPRASPQARPARAPGDTKTAEANAEPKIRLRNLEANASREKPKRILGAGRAKAEQPARASRRASLSRFRLKSRPLARSTMRPSRAKGPRRPDLARKVAQSRASPRGNATDRPPASTFQRRSLRRGLGRGAQGGKAAAQRVSSSLAPWHRMIGERLGSRLRYPSEALECGESGTVVVAFAIVRDGRVSAARVVRSSGWASLDQAALGAVRTAPLPPVPPDIGGARFKFRIPLIYRQVSVEKGVNCPTSRTAASPSATKAVSHDRRARKGAHAIRPATSKALRSTSGRREVPFVSDRRRTAERAVPPKPRIGPKTRAARRPWRPNPPRRRLQLRAARRRTRNRDA